MVKTLSQLLNEVKPAGIPEPKDVSNITPETSDSDKEIETKKFLKPSDINRPVYLMCPPFTLEAGTPNNALMKQMSAKERKINKEKAINQFYAIYSLVSNFGLIYLLPALPGLQDLPYVANLGIKLPHIKSDQVIISNYKSEVRREETPIGVEFFQSMGYETIVAPKYFEGEADLKFINDNNYIGAYGMRTSIECLNWFKITYNMNIVPVKLINEHMYHIDCVVFPLSSEVLFTVTSVIDKPTLKQIEKITKVVDVSKENGIMGLTNSVRMNRMILHGTNITELKKGDEEYTKELNKNNELERLCAQNGFETIFFNISEFMKSGAALSCMFMRLNYPEFNKNEI